MSRTGRYLRAAARLALLAGAGTCWGCLGALQRNLDVILAPDAIGNAWALSAASFGSLVEFLVRLV